MSPALGEARALVELSLEPGTVLIGDLHLDVAPAATPARVAERERFIAWLDALAAPHLVVLGDLFDAWVGPAHALLDGSKAVLDALARATGRGTAVEVVHGNRDFLLERSFERRTGARVHPRGFIGLARGAPSERLLLIHGDELCTRDLGYQRLKRVLRSAPVTWAAPRVPAPVALWAARRLRRASVQALAQKPAEQKTQQDEAVRSLARTHGAGTLVCGHAHRFRDQRLELGEGESVRWLVVGAWGGPDDRLCLGPEGRVELQGPRQP